MERLTKIERKFLKMCNTNDGMTAQKKFNILCDKYSPLKVQSALVHLKESGYINFSPSAESYVYYFELKHKGLNYREITRLEFKAFVYKSVIVPIIVSLLTTLIIYKLPSVIACIK